MSKISQRLDLRQSQNLVMTPQLQQAIKLLQLNNMELAEYVEEELANNPLLEKAEPEGNETAPGEAGDGLPEAPAPEPENSGDMAEDFADSWTGNEADAPAQPSADFDPGEARMGAGGNRNFEDIEDSFENSMSRPVTLREHLLEQLHMDCEDPRDQMIGALLIDQLDETGYLRASQEELAERLACAPERIERLLCRLKTFDPPGIFARDLAECLALQLEDRGTLDAPMKALLENLGLLAAHEMKKLAQVCGVNETYLADMIAEIRTLNPRPASNFEHLIVQTVVPDVLMKALPKHLGGGWRVELNSETLPRVLVNQQYYTEVSGAAKDKADRQYLESQLSNANWLVRALDQRAQTILKTAGEIVEQQDGFFLFGIEFLKPLTLRDIAEKIDMHESTVSRVTTGKYIGTPRGIFELKYFFSSALSGADGTSHSSESIKARIKTMIDAEKPEDILSDDAIAEAIQKDGIDIARRTVAKYREAMNIPSSVLRRKQKKGG